MAEQPESDKPAEGTSNKPKKQLTRNEIIRDFLIGFVGWWIISGLVWLGVTNATFTLPSRIWNELLALFELIFLLLFFLTQLIALILLAFRRGWIALGMLSAIALNLMITLFIGLTQNAFCFAPFFVPLR
ncbi:MAG TPA: hypothetical protein VGA72_00240 [Anaerolineales bacterium]|jgi:hypothetical protein